MNDLQLLRYSRHILLPGIGIEGQQRILDAKIAIIGLGGLGSPAALYLAASGIGQLTLCDHDHVELSNLQRQIIHRTAAIGSPKVNSAASTISDINPEVICHSLPVRIDSEQLDQVIANNDIVLDCSDNFVTRYAINRTCHTYRKPLVSGAAIQFDGMVAVFDFQHTHSACYNCLFAEHENAPELRCATTGIFAPLTGIIGTIQAAETIKLVVGIKLGLTGKLLTVDGLSMNIRTSIVKQDVACPVCTTSTVV
jgi:molybdopterin/thiamine biosynthesis adenylyltransferase